MENLSIKEIISILWNKCKETFGKKEVVEDLNARVDKISIPDLSSYTDVNFGNIDVPYIYMYDLTFNPKLNRINWGTSMSKVIFAKPNDGYSRINETNGFSKKWTFPSSVTSLQSAFGSFRGTLVGIETIDTSKVQDFSYAFMSYGGEMQYVSFEKEGNDNKDILDISWIDASSATDIRGMCANCLKPIINAGMKNMNKVQRCNGVFGVYYDAHRNHNRNKVTTIYLGSNFDLSTCVAGGDNHRVFGAPTHLTTITGTFKWNKNNDLDVRYSPLTADSAMVLINGLPNLETGTHTLYLSSTTYNALSPEQIAVATSKGWTVTK